ncbi:MAG: Type secretion system protein precursor [Pseudomonadota bacterium]
MKFSSHFFAKPTSHSALFALMICAFMVGGVVGNAQAENMASVKPGEHITLNFVNADIEAVARTIATLSGANVVVDPRVKGTMSLSSTVSVSPAEAMRLFAAQLRSQGYALVNNGGIQLVVPEAQAKLQSGPVKTKGAPNDGQVLTQIFRLNNEKATELVPVLRPLISPNNIITVAPGSNALVITDYADNLQRLGRIIATLDAAQDTGVEVIRLQHAIASDLASLVQRLLDGSTTPSKAGATPSASGSISTTVIPEVRTNSLILRAANAEQMSLAKTLVAQLDTPSATGAGAASGNIHVVYLKNAEAVKLAATLRAALSAQGSSGTSVAAGATTGSGAARNNSAAEGALASTGGQIQADSATNSLIITAPEPQYRQLREVIDKLDQRRAQVFVESLIAEVSEDKAAEFGVQWQGNAGNKGDANIGLLGTNFSIGGVNIFSLAQGLDSGTAPSTGFNVGVARQTNGIYVLGFLARMLQSSGDANVLSTPNLLTLDNEEAKIVIGQNVPFVTGQYTNANATGTSVNPFQTIERKDVGLTLRVKPQISDSGSIKMQIYQEVSRLDANTTAGLITNKRSIESNVLVQDGSIVVLGGLLQDDTGNSQQKVPGLGDVPLFGNLFKAESRNRKKTNLMVFLRPVVMRDAASVEALSRGRYEQMRLQQQASQPPKSTTVPVDGAAVLPALPEVKYYYPETFVNEPAQPQR